jgi:hypothetical protein
MIGRRTFLWYGAGMMSVAISASAQEKGIVENGKTVICNDNGSIMCPVCKHLTCKTLNAPVVLGNNNREYPDQSQMYDYKLICCDNCRAAFFA